MSVQTAYTTAPVAAFAGMLADDTENDITTMINAESSASIPFGTPVAYKTSSPTSDKDAILPNATTDKYVGIVVQEHDYARSFTSSDAFGTVTNSGELDSTGLTAGTVMCVLWRGTVWVKVTTAVAPGDRLYIAYNATGSTYTAAGQVGNAAESGHTNDCTAIGRFTSSAAAGGFAKLQVDFSQKP